MIHGASRQSLAAVRERLNEVLAARAGGGTGSSAASSALSANQALADELDSVANLLGSQPRLRRTLADPATDAESRGRLVRSILDGKVGAEALEIIAAAVTQRWSTPWDLADALSVVSDDVLLASAEQDGQLDEVEDELFRFERILADNGQLVTAFDDANASTERRVDLLKSVLADKVNPITFALIEHAINSSRKNSLQLALDDLLEASAVRRNRSVARVLSASELTDAQTDRLSSALTGLYGRPISVRSAVDPSVKGGLEVRVGDELIDGTIATRLAATRAALAG
ncbi:MAG: synthase subunit delta [Pseudonocardiales bacterium]|nr:synthase subunit delta [Pseudonocardiales bacterium]